MALRPRPRVLVVGPRPPGVGGMVSVITRQLNGPLAGQVEMCCLADNPEWLRGWGLAGSILRHLGLLCVLAGRLIAGRIDILHRHTCSFRTFDRSVIDILVARLVRKKVVLHLHGGRFCEDYRGRSALGRRLVQLGLRIAHTVVVLHEEQGRWVESIGSPNVRVVPNGVALPPETPSNCAAEDHCRVLYVGELSIAKGLPELLCAVAELRQSTAAPFRLYLAGPASPDVSLDSLRSQLRRLQIESIVEPLGALEEATLSAWYRRADILVLPSRAEALPMCVLEGMSYGVPVVATGVGALPEMLAGGCGVLVPSGDVRGLAGALRGWIADPRARRAAGNAARRRVECQYSDSHFSDRMVSVYQELLAPRGGAVSARTVARPAWRRLPTRGAQELPSG